MEVGLIDMAFGSVPRRCEALTCIAAQPARARHPARYELVSAPAGVDARGFVIKRSCTTIENTKFVQVLNPYLVGPDQLPATPDD